jgi:hypothetical protein
MQLFLGISAVEGMLITYGRTTNVYQQSPPTTKQCYVTVDYAYHSWHKKRYGTDVDPKDQVVPLGRALQGHPEADILWETMIVGVLEGDKLGFKSMTHERNLYIGTIDGECVLVQTRDYIKISCDTYLARVLQTHSWEKPSLKSSDWHDSVPMSVNVSKKLCTLSGPAEGTHENAALAKKTGFSYHQVLGELIYAYVVC